MISCILAVLLSLCGLILAVGYYALWNTEFYLEPIRDYLGNPDADPVLLYTAISIAFTLILSIISYILTLDSKRTRRPRLLLFFIFWGIAIQCSALAASMQTNLVMAISIAVVTAFGLPFLIFPVESIFRTLLLVPGKFFLRLGKYGPAAFFLSKGLLFQPSHTSLMESLGQSFHLSGKPARAREYLVPLVQDKVASEETIRYLVEGYEQEKDHLRALEYLALLRERRPDDPKIRARLIDIYVNMGWLDHAIPLVEEEMDWESVEDILRLADLYARKAEWPRVRKLLADSADLEKGNCSRTLFEYRRIVQNNPDYMEITRDLAELLWNMGRKQEAADYFERFLSHDPDDMELRRRLLDYYLEVSHVIMVEKHIEYLIKKGEMSPLIMREYAQLLIQKENLEDAMEHLAQARRIYPEHYQFPFIMAQIHYEAGRYDDARREMAETMKIVPPENKDEVSLLHRKIEGAIVNAEIKILKDKINDDPQNADLRMELVDRLMANAYLERVTSEIDSLLYYKPELRPAVIEFIEKLADKYSRNYLLLDYLADMYLRDSNFEKCMGIYEKMACQSLEPRESIRASCNKLIKINSKFIPALLRLGDLAHEDKDHETMIHLYCRCMEIAPESMTTRLDMLFDALCEVGDFKKAEGVGLYILKSSPENSQVIIRMGKLALESGRLETAIDYFESALKIDSANQDTRSLLQQANRLLKKRHLDNTLQKLEAEPDNSEFRELAGDLLCYFEEYTEAVKHYQRAAQLSPQPDLCKAKLAFALAKRGMLDLAEETLNEVRLVISEHPRQQDLKTFIYLTAAQFERELEPRKAIIYYKQIFRVDAGFRDVVQRIEKIESLGITTTPYGKKLRVDTPDAKQ